MYQSKYQIDIFVKELLKYLFSQSIDCFGIITNDIFT